MASPTATPANVPATNDVNTVNFEELLNKLQQMGTFVKELQVEARNIQKQVTKLSKVANKNVRRAARKRLAVQGGATGTDTETGNKTDTEKTPRMPSGFAKPTVLSNELCGFLGLDEGSERSRTEVTRMLNHYIKEHDLQNPTDRRNILPDDKLKGLLRLSGDEKVTYFNIQSFMKPHYSSVFPANASVSVTGA
jgi:chromatin remodeling complex protein RSC6